MGTKAQDRAAMRWTRDGCCLLLQWKDNKPVTILSSIDDANKRALVSRIIKIANAWRSIEVPQPKAIQRYNKHVNGVGSSDQKLAKETQHTSKVHKVVKNFIFSFYSHSSC